MSMYQEKGVSEEISEIIELVKEPKNFIEGEYLGKREFDGKKPGEVNTLHMFKVKDKIVGSWGSKDINDKLRGEEHKNVHVQFKEKREIGAGRTFKVFVVKVAQ